MHGSILEIAKNDNNETLITMHLKEEERLRPLNNIEQFYAKIAELGGSMIISVIRFHGKVSNSELKIAADHWQHHFPALQVTLKENHHGSFYFEKTFKDIPLNICYRNNLTTWKDNTSTDLYSTFSITTNDPLVRLSWIKNPNQSGYHELIIKFHPSIVDHQSAIFLTNSLFSTLSSVLNHKISFNSLHQLYQKKEHNNLFMGFEDQFFRHTPRQDQTYFSNMDLVKLSQLQKKHASYPRETRWLSFKLSVSQTQKIRYLSEKYGLTLKDTLSASLQLALSHLFRRSNFIHNNTFYMSGDMNLRPFNPHLTNNEVGCLSGIYFYPIKTATHASLWDQALINKNYRHQTQVKGLWSLTPLHHHLHQISVENLDHSELIKKAQHQNVGRYSLFHINFLETSSYCGSTHPGLSLEQMSLITGQHILGSVLHLNASILKNSLSGNLSYIPAIIEEDLVVSILQQVLIFLTNPK